MFCVVDFLTWSDKNGEDTDIEPMRETAIVPENWLTPQKKKSHWPPHFKETMLKMPLNSSWPDYEVEIRGTYDSYPKARMKLQKAVETDNFESASEFQGKIKRKRKVPKRLDDSSSEPDESDAQCFLPTPPKINHLGKYKKDITKENKEVIKNNQNMKHGRSSSGSSFSMDSFPKQKSNNLSVGKSPSILQSTSCAPWKKSAKSICFMNKIKNKQHDISDDCTSHNEIESSAVASHMNHSVHDFDNGNYEKHSPKLSKTHNMEYSNPDSSLRMTTNIQRKRQFNESQPRDCAEKNNQAYERLPRYSPTSLSSSERTSTHRNILPPKHLKQQYERSDSNLNVMSTQRIQGNFCHDQTPTSSNRQQLYPSDGVKRTLQEIIKNQEEIKAKLRNHDIMMDNILMHVGNNDSAEQLMKPQGWPDNFPLSNIEALWKFESFLEKKNNFSFTVKYFSIKCYTSNSCEEMTRNICRFIFSKDLKKKLNWRGTTMKSGLKTMKTGSLISDAVFLKYKSSGLQQVVTKTISTWLRNNITSGEKNNKEQNEEKVEDEYSDSED